MVLSTYIVTDTLNAMQTRDNGDTCGFTPATLWILVSVPAAPVTTKLTDFFVHVRSNKIFAITPSRRTDEIRCKSLNIQVKAPCPNVIRFAHVMPTSLCLG